MAFNRGTFRVRGDTLEIIPAYEELAIRIEMFGDEIERLYYLHPLTGDVVREVDQLLIFPATHYAAGPERMERAIRGIEAELEERLAELERQGKLLEAQRLRMRTTYDIEMMRQVGFCSGIENYSRHIDGREPGSPPHCLLDYFPDDFLTVIDESHVTVPQIGGMYEGDASRKRIADRARLPAAAAPPTTGRCGSTSSWSGSGRSSTCRPRPAPGSWRRPRARWSSRSSGRPAWSTRRWSSSRPRARSTTSCTRSRLRAERDERVLVTTLTKKMAEDLTDYLLEHGIRVRYLHSEVDTLRRVELLRELRKGDYDVLVGINLLREGLDLPEVSLVAILDADKEGFLRSAHVADPDHRPGGPERLRPGAHVRRQDHAVDGGRDRGDQPAPGQAGRVQRGARRRPAAAAQEDPRHPRRHLPRGAEDTLSRARGGGGGAGRCRGARRPVPETRSRGTVAEHRARARGWPGPTSPSSSRSCTDQMLGAARELQFELAARIRDEIAELKKELRAMDVAGVQ